MNKKGKQEIEKKRKHRKWKYEELKKKLKEKKPNWHE